jgi:hypothetical protein
MTDASEAARALAARRRRTIFVCEVCGQPFEAWERATQRARTCSGACRVKLHRQSKQEPKVGRPLIEVLAEDD